MSVRGGSEKYAAVPRVNVEAVAKGREKTYLISLWTTPRLCRNSTPERRERNHSLA